MGGSGTTRGDKINSRGGQEASIPDKKRGTMRDGSATRSGQLKHWRLRRRWRHCCHCHCFHCGVTRGDTKTSKGGREESTPDKKRGMTRGGWRDEKWTASALALVLALAASALALSLSPSLFPSLLLFPLLSPSPLLPPPPPATASVALDKEGNGDSKEGGGL
jgi:hypothetical protein